MHELDYNFDRGKVQDLEDCKKHKRKDIIVLPAELLEKESNTGEMVNKKIMQWINKFRAVLFFILILALLALTARTIYLEVKVHSYPNRIHNLNKQINELYKSNAQWKGLYEE